MISYSLGLILDAFTGVCTLALSLSGDCDFAQYDNIRSTGSQPTHVCTAEWHNLADSGSRLGSLPGPLVRLAVHDAA